MWGDQQVCTLLYDRLEEEAPLHGFNLKDPDFTTNFSSVYVGSKHVLKVHHQNHELQFRREISALRQLSDVPGIPRVEAVIHAGDTGGAFIMPRFKPPPFELYRSSADGFMSLLQPLVDLLVAAHGRGIAHCDLKDSALMMDCRGKLVVTDWNLARSAEWDPQGRVVGTPQFCLALWRPATAAAQDCCSLGVLLGWIVGLADLGEAEDYTFEDTLDRVEQQHRIWEEEPPEEEELWHTKVLMLVRLLLVCNNEPLQVTYAKWLYGVWLSGEGEQELSAYVRERRRDADKQIVGFQEHLMLLQCQARGPSPDGNTQVAAPNDGLDTRSTSAANDNPVSRGEEALKKASSGLVEESGTENLAPVAVGSKASAKASTVSVQQHRVALQPLPTNASTHDM